MNGNGDAEERSAPRHRVLKGGQIRFGQSAIDCVIRDLSATGARIKINSPLWYPDAFTLVLTADGTARKCRVVWRGDREIGLAFEDDR